MTGTVLPQALFDAYDRLYAEIGRLHALIQISTQGGVKEWFESVFRQHEVVREAQTEILQHCEGTFALLSARDLPRNELAQLIAMVRNGESTEEAWQRFVAQWPRAYAEALEVTVGANPATPPAKGKAGGEGFLGVKSLAQKHGVEAEALRKRLERWREKRLDDYIENDGRKPNEEKFLYREAAVLDIIHRMRTKQAQVSQENKICGGVKSRARLPIAGQKRPAKRPAKNNLAL